MDIVKAEAILRKSNVLNNKILFIGACDSAYKKDLDTYIQKHS